MKNEIMANEEKYIVVLIAIKLSSVNVEKKWSVIIMYYVKWK